MHQILFESSLGVATSFFFLDVVKMRVGIERTPEAAFKLFYYITVPGNHTTVFVLCFLQSYEKICAPLRILK